MPINITSALWGYMTKRFCDQGDVLHRLKPNGEAACGARSYASCGAGSENPEGQRCRNCLRLKKSVVYVRATDFNDWCAYFSSVDPKDAERVANERAERYPNDFVEVHHARLPSRLQ